MNILKVKKGRERMKDNKNLKEMMRISDDIAAGKKARSYEGPRRVDVDDSRHVLKIGEIVTPNEEFEKGSPPRVNRKEKDKNFSGYGGAEIGHIGRLIGYRLDKGSTVLSYLGPCEPAIVEDLETGETWTMSETLLCRASDRLRKYAKLLADAEVIVEKRLRWQFWRK